MIDLNDYAKVIDGEKWVLFDKAVAALNELAKVYSTEKLDEALNQISKATQIMSDIEKEDLEE